MGADVSRPATRRAAARRADRGAAAARDSRRTPARRAAGGAALAPLSPKVDLGAEVKRLYDRLFCEGRASDASCRKLAASIARYRKRYLAPMRKWLAPRRPDTLPPTLLYPFAGGDLVSAVTAFPEQRRYVHLSLEHGGPPEPLQGLAPGQIRRARRRLHWMANKLLSLGESFSDDLQVQEATRLPGVLPLLLVGLRVHGGQVTGLAYLRLTEKGRLEPYTREELRAEAPRARRRFTTWKDPRFSKRYSHLELRFRLPGDTTDRRVIHVSANLADAGLKRTPGVARFLSSIGPHALMIKASSYLLWTGGFSRIRKLAFADAAFALSDFTAPIPRWLRAHGFSFEAHGRYDCVRNPKLRGSAKPWVRVFEKPETPKIPFRWGYVDCHGHNHIVIIRPS